VLLTAEQVAEQLQVSTYQVLALGRAGTLPRVLIGRSVRFRPEDITEFVEQCATPPQPATRVDWKLLR